MADEIRGFFDATCPRCHRRIGWCGTLQDRPRCPCGNLPSEQLAKDAATLADAIETPPTGYWDVLRSLASFDVRREFRWWKPSEIAEAGKLPDATAERELRRAVARGDVRESIDGLRYRLTPQGRAELEIWTTKICSGSRSGSGPGMAVRSCASNWPPSVSEKARKEQDRG